MELDELGKKITQLRLDYDETKSSYERDMAYCKQLGEAMMGSLSEKCDHALKQCEFFEAESKRKSEEIKQLLAEKETLLAEKKCRVQKNLF